MRNPGEETAVTEDKTNAFIAPWEHQRMLSDPCGPSGRNRNNRRAVHPRKIAKDLGSVAHYYLKKNGRTLD